MPFVPIRAAALAAALLLSACNPAVTACRQQARCTGDDDVDTCVDDAREGRDEAKEAGCESEYDALWACNNDNAECQGSDYDVGLFACGDEAGQLTACLIDAAF